MLSDDQICDISGPLMDIENDLDDVIKGLRRLRQDVAEGDEKRICRRASKKLEEAYKLIFEAKQEFNDYFDVYYEVVEE